VWGFGAKVLEVFWKRREDRPSIVGKWMGRVSGEPVAMEFRDDGRLAYVVLGPEGKTQIMRLVYRIEGDTLITDQTGHPHEERSTFRIDGDLLSITFDGELTQFRRER
jgi:hypothetical protein